MLVKLLSFGRRDALRRGISIPIHPNKDRTHDTYHQVLPN